MCKHLADFSGRLLSFGHGNRKSKPAFTILLFSYTCKCIFGDGYATLLSGHVAQEGGWDTGVGRSSSINPNSRILFENLLYGKKLGQMMVSVNSLQLKNAIGYFSSNAFGKVKNLSNLLLT